MDPLNASPETDMNALQTLLVATDFSSAAKHAEERAALLAAEHDARLILLHNLSGLGLQSLRERLTQDHAEIETQLLNHYRDALQRLAEDLAARWRIAVTPLLTAGQAHREIRRAAAETGADLVVVGASGEHPVREFFLGSTAERVVRESPAPILVVRNAVREPYARVLAALDLSPYSQAVLELARRVAPTAHLTLGHAFEAPFEHKLRYAGVSEIDLQRYSQSERERALAGLQALAPTGAPSIRLEHGMPESVLPALLRETAAELVITGKHGHSEIVDLFLGSMTKHLLREAGCDVLVTPPPSQPKT